MSRQELASRTGLIAADALQRSAKKTTKKRFSILGRRSVHQDVVYKRKPDT